jgi:hypothetical protein
LMLLVLETHGEVSKLEELLLPLLVLFNLLVHSKLLLKENSTSELLVWIHLETSI